MHQRQWLISLKAALIAGAGTFLIAGCGVESTPATPPHDSNAAAERIWEAGAMVASANPLATEAGLDVLRNGGSAVDAAIAVQAVLSLVEPQSSGLAGGAFMMHYDFETRRVSAYNGRETAPMSVDETLWLDAEGEPLGFLAAKTSGRAIGVPGITDMLAAAHVDHGRLEWSGLFDEAIRLSEEGFRVSPRMASSLAFADRFGLRDQPALRAYFSDENGDLLQEGHLLKNPDYAVSLRALADNPRAFYETPIIDQIIDAASAEPLPGGLTADDFYGYMAEMREPICTRFRDVQICGHPMPSSGGLAVAQIMELVERIGWAEGGFDNFDNWARFAEAQRLAYADRERYAADDRQVLVPVGALLDPSYLDERAALIEPGRGAETVVAGDISGWEGLGNVEDADSPGTSHFVVVDQWGDVVSMTTTVESAFGSFRMAGGMILNNQLTDFTFTPLDDEGRPTANRPGPGKHPRSSMSPTIVLDEEGEFLFATGSPGGTSIIAYTTKSLIGTLEFGLHPQEAAALPNVVARGPVRVEPMEKSEGWKDAFEERGFPTADSRGENSGIHSVLLMPDGTLAGAADPRREGVVAQP